ncbi:acyl-CoA dehydrogenase family protein [Nocardioides sp. AE5]|uniref:acyl-CoA dehydrogenase family protein n=1 Tax=Nocardioides sp. AE5 TaxID=2962573 RepID=UPI0028820266|nr:acyl-CoA dehydrogenase family protein [Nocardioides sp. AE5]MDT0202689.1 acyl-CoA dehydrogenase family protein [Nocardioides sp. AE5]
MILDDPEVAGVREEFADVLESLLGRTSPESEVVHRADACAAGHLDEALWTKLTEELGVTGLTAPERVGGSGATFGEMSVVLHAQGAHLLAIPLLGSWLALEAVLRSGSEPAVAAWARGLASGATIGGIAFHGRLAASAGEETTVSGTLEVALDAVDAEVLVARVQGPDGPGLCAVDLSGAVVEQTESLDLVRRLARVRLVDAAAIRLADGDELFDTVVDLAAAALACEQLGVAEKALADAVGYAMEREQFGRIIGSFQGLKHELANMATITDQARSLVEHAMWSVVEAPDQLRVTAAMALLKASEAALHVSAENVQVHGGIGFSWEHPAHLHFRKARSNAVLIGDEHFLADRVLQASARWESVRDSVLPEIS